MIFLSWKHKKLASKVAYLWQFGFFFSAALTAQNSPKLIIRLIDSCIQWSVVLYLGFQCFQYNICWLVESQMMLYWKLLEPNWKILSRTNKLFCCYSKFRLFLTRSCSIFSWSQLPDLPLTQICSHNKHNHHITWP